MRIPERRKYTRYGIQLDVEIGSGPEVWPAFLSDIGMGGMFVVTSTPLLVGASCTVRVLVDPPLVFSCLVRRVLPGRGMGVMFGEMPDSVRVRLEKLLAKIAAG